MQEIIKRMPCRVCRQPSFACFCEHIEAFDPKIKFVILIHPIEVRRRIATGRMAHLCLKNSVLIEGHDYSRNDRVNAILQNPDNHCVVLYPGVNATNITPLTSQERAGLFPTNKELVIFVIDGTWNTARKTLHLSKNLHPLSQFFFTPDKPSNIRVRLQPNPHCLSTIEAIHQTISLLGSSRGFDLSQNEHEKLLHVFNKVIERQLVYVTNSTGSRHQLF